MPRRLHELKYRITNTIDNRMFIVTVPLSCQSSTRHSDLCRHCKVRFVYKLLDFFSTRYCVCVFSSHSFWKSSSLDVPAGVTQEEGHTGFLIHLLSAVRALIFFARRIQPFLSLVDREVEFCVLTISSFSTRWAFLFLFFSDKNPVCRDRTHVPTCQGVTRYL